ncbi:hypothetical protein BB560_003083 [Smittium megazygosporum]|uniref:Srp40 C-terminal domain-containing protein n=1 Tax=Smittium megazygosporum TaxID=133381 RepID=A0A2T9ZCZ1_9FUNG|nr:hypothetical protein BB560_003083 [Smittium megazygosporum]
MADSRNDLFKLIQKFLLDNDLKASANALKKEANLNNQVYTGPVSLDQIFTFYSEAKSLLKILHSNLTQKIPNSDSDETKKPETESPPSPDSGSNSEPSTQLTKPETESPPSPDSGSNSEPSTQLTKRFRLQLQLQLNSSDSESSEEKGSPSQNKSTDSKDEASNASNNEFSTPKKRKFASNESTPTNQSNIKNANIAPATAPVTNNASFLEYKNNKKPKVVKHFSRINPEKVEFLDERLKDNTYLAKGETQNDFGLKAHHDLIVTRGKGFTKEKNKKKKGSYSGGAITLGSNSIKFD